MIKRVLESKVFMKMIQEGDTVYYVTEDAGVYRIHKTRITERTLNRHDGLRMYFESEMYRCEDGHTADTAKFCAPFFKTIAEAVAFIVDELQSNVNWARISLFNARQHLEQMERSLRFYKNMLKKTVFPREAS